MADKNTCINKPYVIYDREKELINKKPDFKPGNTPHCHLGEEVLNGRVNWMQTLAEILATGHYTLSAIGNVTGVEPQGLALVLENDLRFLTFKAGAKLLALYEKAVVGPRLLLSA